MIRTTYIIPILSNREMPIPGGVSNKIHIAIWSGVHSLCADSQVRVRPAQRILLLCEPKEKSPR